jgi:copper(I)-binding protein
MKRIVAAAFVAWLAAPAAHAQVTVKEAWVRATVPQQKATAAFMQLTSVHGGRLLEARSPVAKVVEIHEMSMANQVMRMRPVEAVELPAGKTVELKPSGYHIMMMELAGQIKEGDSVPLTLVVEHKDGKRESIELKVVARPLTATGSGHSHADHGGGAHKGH